jgi:hypothetical protein
MTLKEILAKHPAPWRYAIHAGNAVKVLDAQGIEVPMFVMLDLLVLVTARMGTPS